MLNVCNINFSMQANEFVKNFTFFSFYGLHEVTTVDSLMITLLQHFSNSAETVHLSAGVKTASNPVGISSSKPVQVGYLLETLLDSLRRRGYLNIPVVRCCSCKIPWSDGTHITLKLLCTVKLLSYPMLTNSHVIREKARHFKP